MATRATKATSSSTSSTSTTSKDDTTTKTRIITHMNADHTFSLSLYLRHYSAIPASLSHPALLTDITPSYMLITSPPNNTTTMIPFTPPLTSLSQSRERIIQMHHEALAALDLSDIQITEWKPPSQLWQWALTLLCAVCYPSFATAGDIRPEVNGWNYKVWSVGGLVPWWARITHALAVYALVFMTVAHVVETGYFVMKPLRRHRVVVRGGVWWAWVANCLLTGAGAITRFEGLVREKEEEARRVKAKVKH